jgi:hypothetical protein
MKKINFAPEDSQIRPLEILCVVCKHPIKNKCKSEYCCEAYLAVKKAIEEAQ